MIPVPNQSAILPLSFQVEILGIKQEVTVKKTDIPLSPMERNSTHPAGEYFVAAELYRRGFSVGMTIGNAKAIDLFANKDNKTISIQVKAIKNTKALVGL